jgi:cbb3-type cytochrome oxidase cytochrome c subunit
VKLRAGEWVVLGGSGVIAAFAALVGVLIYLKPPPVEYSYAETAAARDGEAIYRREGCNSCHRLFGNGATYGPALDGVGSRRSADWLRDYLQNPKPGVSGRPYRVSMPSYGRLQSGELSALVAYLQGLRAVSAEGASTDAPKGR